MKDLTNTNKTTKMPLFGFTCAYGGNMVIIKPRFLKRRPGRQLLAAILGPPLGGWMVIHRLFGYLAIYPPTLFPQDPC
jgi:hypothetical protein